ncbi:MAG: phosphoglucosamine mutase [Flavobacteriales bacterium]|nr:phosphoglucosamine mutase [Flavobacteriales bacterium]
MTLIRSISGIRGTIGGRPGEALTPSDIVRYTAAYAMLIRHRSGAERPLIVVGRDARPSGPMVRDIVTGTLSACGCDVVDLGPATTPTVEMAVTDEQADGGIIVTASHNPVQWNALKLLNERGEFISAKDGEEVLRMAASDEVALAQVDALGVVTDGGDRTDRHIETILKLPYVDADAIRRAGFAVVVDAVNSVGGIAVPRLLEALGVKRIIPLYCLPDGLFPHDPEPLPDNLKDLCAMVVNEKADIGIAVDPDVDRLALVCENGALFGEEYTLVACADHVLSKRKGDTVSNLSSTQALGIVSRTHGVKRHTSAVGEVNVVARMKEVDAVIGGEGNGGVILPELHYGRDALAGIALFLTLLAERGGTCSELRATYPDRTISKKKVRLEPGMDVEALIDAMRQRHADTPHSTEDGLWMSFGDDWVHLRRSNTEPIMRIYAESATPQRAEALAERTISELKELIGTLDHSR